MPFVCNAYNSVDTNMKICTGRWFCKEREGIEHRAGYNDGGESNRCGFPIGTMLAKEFETSEHASTFGGNPLACAASIRVVEEEKLASHLR